MEIGSILSSSYSVLMQSTKKNATEADSAEQTKELSEVEKLENFKKEIWNEIDSMPRNKSINQSIQITDKAFKRMMEEPEFKEEMMNILREDAAAGRPPITSVITTINEDGYNGYSYNFGYGEEAFAAHAKGKDSFYVKKASKKQDYTELWEKERLERKMQQKKLDEEYVDDLYWKRSLVSQQQAAKLYDDNVGLPDFNDIYFFTKKETGTSDSEYKKAIVEQAV